MWGKWSSSSHSTEKIHNWVAEKLNKESQWWGLMFTQFKIKSQFGAKDPTCIPMCLRSRVIYKFSCAGCSACYIGETNRHFATRCSPSGIFSKVLAANLITARAPRNKSIDYYMYARKNHSIPGPILTSFWGSIQIFATHILTFSYGSAPHPPTGRFTLR